MKLIYPKDNLYDYCKNDIENCHNNISDIIAENSFKHIPSDFVYLEFLQNLNNSLAKNKQEIIDIEKKIKSTDKEYNLLSEILTNETNKIIISKIKKRNRMIK